MGQSRFSGLAFVGAANLFSVVSGGVFWIFLAPLLSVEAYGHVQYDYSIPGILAAFAIMGLATTVTTYRAKGNTALAGQANFLILITTCALSVPLFLFMDWVLGLLLITNNFFHMSTALLLGKKSYREFSTIMIGSRVLQIALSLGLYYVMGDVGILIGYAASFLIFGYRYLLNLRPNDFSFGEVRRYWKFTFYNFASHVLDVMYVFFDKVLIGTLYGFEFLGIYALAFQFISALNFLPSSLGQFLLPEEASGANTKKIRILGYVGSISLTVVAFFAIPVFIHEFLADYSEATGLLQIMILAIFPSTVSAIHTSKITSTGNGRPHMVGLAIFVSIHLAGVVVLGGIYGIEGIGISFVAASTAQAVFLWAYVMRYMGKKF